MPLFNTKVITVVEGQITGIEGTVSNFILLQSLHFFGNNLNAFFEFI